MPCPPSLVDIMALLSLLMLISPAAAQTGSGLQEPLSAAASPPPAPETNQTQLTVCVVNWEPVAICSPDRIEPYSAANFTGHDVQLVRAVASLLGLKEGSDYRFLCDSFATMVDSLVNATGPCDAAASFVTITSEREASGIKFTYPYYKSGLSTMVHASRSTSSGWGFTRPFSWDLWLALFLTLLIFPPIVFLIEFLSLRKAIHRGDVAPGVIESSWRTAITLMLMDSFSVTALGSRLAVLCFCFLALLTTSTYTANLAAFVTVNTINSRITSLEDLRGRAVGTSPIYIQRLQNYGIQGIPYPLQYGSDYLKWRDLVISGELSALVRDTPALEWLVNTAPLCNVALLPQEIEPFDYGVAFRSGTADSVVGAWSRAILALQEDGTLQRLKQRWIDNPDIGCQEAAQINQNAQAVSFTDLYGLWIILGAGLALGMLTMIAQRSARRYRKHHGSGLGGCGGSAPLPEGARPRRLLSAAASLGRRGTLRKPAGGTANGGQQVGSRSKQGQQPNGQGVVMYQVRQVLPGPGHIGWDLESANSAQPPAAQPGAAGTPQSPAQARAVAAGPQQGSLPAPPPSPPVEHPSSAPGGSGGVQHEEQRMSALQAVDSIYAAHKWRSVLKTGASSDWRADSA